MKTVLFSLLICTLFLKLNAQENNPALDNGQLTLKLRLRIRVLHHRWNALGNKEKSL